MVGREERKKETCINGVLERQGWRDTKSKRNLQRFYERERERERVRRGGLFCASWVFS